MARGAEKTIPARNGVAVTASDTTTYPECRGIYVGVTGNLTVDFRDGGTNITFIAVPAGTLFPFDILRVKAATTAASIVIVF